MRIPTKVLHSFLLCAFVSGCRSQPDMRISYRDDPHEVEKRRTTGINSCKAIEAALQEWERKGLIGKSDINLSAKRTIDGWFVQMIPQPAQPDNFRMITVDDNGRIINSW